MGIKVAGKVAMAVLIFINIIIIMLGIGLLVMGIVFRTNSDVFFEDDVVDYLNEVDLYSTVGLGDLFTNLSIYVIIVGILLLLFGLLGSIAACSKNKCLLITYLILVIIMFINTVICLGFWIYMNDELEEDIRSELFNSLELYDGPDATDSQSQGLDKVQIELKCCGSKPVDSNNNPNEFKNSKWHKNKRKNANEKVPSSCCSDATKANYKSLNNPNCQENLQGYNTKGTKTLHKNKRKNANEKVPSSCCSDATKANYKSLNNPNCQENLQGYNTKGCDEAIEEEADSYELYVYMILGGALGIEVLALVFTILLLLAVKGGDGDD